MRYAWRRSLRPLTDSGGQQQHLFPTGREDSGQLHLDEMRDVPVVVVLGERGSGKSVTLEQEHTLLTERRLLRFTWARTSPTLSRQAPICASTCKFQLMPRHRRLGHTRTGQILNREMYAVDHDSLGRSFRNVVLQVRPNQVEIVAIKEEAGPTSQLTC